MGEPSCGLFNEYNELLDDKTLKAYFCVVNEYIHGIGCAPIPTHT